MTPPVLTTERLVLRGPKPADYPAYEAFMTSDRSQHAGGPLTEALAWRAFATVIGHWTLRGFGMWTVTDRTTKAPIGLIGLWYPKTKPEKEIGWTIWPEAEGKGLAFEAAQAARHHAYHTLGWPTAVSYIAPENARSIALAERLGCVRDDAAGKPHPEDLVYRHPSPEALT